MMEATVADSVFDGAHSVRSKHTKNLFELNLMH